MAAKLSIARTLNSLRRHLSVYHEAGDRVALVPTMGALHDGHMSLVRLAKRRAKRVVVSIFVNPTQFAPNEDFASYPRDLARDAAALRREGVDLIWAPPVHVVYPEGFATALAVEGPAKAGLEDKFRPHHFGGVATVVAKLFLQCQPDIAMFGQKDYQQLKVITRMAKDLDFAVKVVGAPIIREKDGLALSSRNAYLSRAEREIAPTLHRVLASCAVNIKKGGPVTATLNMGRKTITAAGFTLDYLEARHADTLAPVSSYNDGPIRVLVAARIGRTRLIDNVAV